MHSFAYISITILKHSFGSLLKNRGLFRGFRSINIKFRKIQLLQDPPLINTRKHFLRLFLKQRFVKKLRICWKL